MSSAISTAVPTIAVSSSRKATSLVCFICSPTNSNEMTKARTPMISTLFLQSKLITSRLAPNMAWLNLPAFLSTAASWWRPEPRLGPCSFSGFRRCRTIAPILHRGCLQRKVCSASLTDYPFRPVADNRCYLKSSLIASSFFVVLRSAAFRISTVNPRVLP